MDSPTDSAGFRAPVVALDGPSGSGKSSVARSVAQALGLRYLDTGAMYRAMTWWMLEHAVDIADPGAVAAAAHKPGMRVGTDPLAPAIHVDEVDVSGPIRTREVSNAVSPVSAVPEVRARLVALQRDIIGAGGIVVEGRDIGTTVAPAAPVKVFLTASAAERAQRRALELSDPVDSDPVDSGPEVAGTTGEAGAFTGALDRTHAELARRDLLDSSRAASPTARADDAVEVDSTGLSLEEVVAAVLRIARERTEVPQA